MEIWVKSSIKISGIFAGGVEPERWAAIMAPMKHLLKNLIQAESTPDRGELNAAEVLRDYFAAHGLAARIDAWGTGRANLVLHLPSGGQKPALLFASHLDVVPAGLEPWDFAPFKPQEIDGKIFGRGACDMKGGLTAAAVAVVELLEQGAELRGDLIFAATAGEETDSIGAARFVSQYMQTLPDLAGIVIPEPTNFQMITAHRGILWLDVTTFGRTAHGSMPHLGVNAISSMQKILNMLSTFEVSTQSHPRLGQCTLSINRIHGGNAYNVVPDRCEIGIDIRTIPGQDHQAILARLREEIDRIHGQTPDDAFRYEIKTARGVPAMETDETCDFVRTLGRVAGVTECTAVGYTTDGPQFAPLRAPVVIYGPGRSEVCHKPNEYIDFADVKKAKDLYKALIGELLT